MAFTPTFVDLVRNYTITQGTGPFVLGPPVNGFSSFTSALQPGDSFYYSALGVDKPNEREVGRGTLQADGTISRSPISGAPTSFTGGSKTVALIAAAEWFNSVQAGAGSSAVPATRGELAATEARQAPAMLTEAGREGLFVFDAADHSSSVAADPRQGVHVPPASDPTGASGAWVRKFSGPLDVRWFGAVADNATDASPAINAAFRFAESGATASHVSPVYRGGAGVFIPPGAYYCESPLEPLATLAIRGAGGVGWGAATRLRFAPGVTGLRAQAYDTSGASAIDTADHFSGDSLVIEDIYFQGAFTSVEADAHGCHTKRPIHLNRCTFDGFEGDGLYAHTSGRSGSPDEGNSNCSRITDCVFTSNRNGLSISGGDANAWLIQGCNFTYNRAWGVNDTSFLGNTYIACHSDGNGIMETSASLGASVVSHMGNRYAAIDGQQAGAAANAPSGTSADNAWWYYMASGAAAGSAIPAWSNGMPVRPGGAYRTNNTNASNAFYGCYSESGQGPSQFTYPTRVDGGSMSSGVRGYATYSYNSQGWWRVGIPGSGRGAIIDGASTVNGTMAVDGGAGSGTLNIQGQGASPMVNLIESGTTYASLYCSGSALYLNGSNSLNFQVAGATRLSIDANGNLAAQGAMTTTAGGVGYAAGAGGAAIQATSKSTAVTLGKPSGKITMNAASLAAGASVGFTLTNAAIAASDVVVVNIASGASADSYTVTVDAVSAASCRISLCNISGAALAEAVVLNFAVIKAVSA